MRRGLVTGMSGIGKSTGLAELIRRGFETARAQGIRAAADSKEPDFGR